MDRILALDFGGTKHTAAVISLAAVHAFLSGKLEVLHWEAQQRVFSPRGADARYDLETMLSLGHSLLGGRPPAAIGVSFGGPVDYRSGLVRLSHHVPGWEDTPLAEMLEKTFQAPARVDNDANVAALGESCFGAGRSSGSLMYITVSTGVGGGWILDGRPWRGWEGMAGEIGHTVVDPQGPLCLCGKHGCVERLASGPYVARDAVRELESDPQAGPVLRRLAGGHTGQVTGELVGQAASAGDPLASRLLDRSARALGAAIGNTANLINPRLFVLGGGVTKSGERWWSLLRETASQTALPEVHFDILPTALGDDAPLWGAVALAQEALGETSPES